MPLAIPEELALPDGGLRSSQWRLLVEGYHAGLHHSERASGQEAWLVLVLFLSATAAALAARWYFQGRCAARGSREDPLLLELQSLEEGLRDAPANVAFNDNAAQVQPPEFVRPGLEPPVSLPSELGPPATSPTELSLPNRGLALSVSLPTEPGSTASVPILTQPTSLVSSPTHPGSPVSLPPEPASQGTAPPSAAMLCPQRPSVLHHDDEEWRPDGGDPESEPWVEEEEPQVELWLEAKEWKSICRFARVYEERLHHAKERGLVGGSLA
ncbi:unnamed protein product [Symbiodinium sp. CCMP2592]|nr:unnamed protein product [Symbiodinium sp. CCMP2592]